MNRQTPSQATRHAARPLTRPRPPRAGPFGRGGSTPRRGPWPAPLAWALGLLAGLAGCADAERAASRGAAVAVPSAIRAAAAIPPEPSACRAPSVVQLDGLDDARDLSALPRCDPAAPWGRACEVEQPTSDRCGQEGFTRRVPLARLDEAVLLDAAARARVREVFSQGQRRGRRADVVGLAGDSLTIDHAFLRPFGRVTPDRVVVPPAVGDRLRLADGTSVIDFFRRSLDAFTTIRAAKVGARAKWAVTIDPASRATPLTTLISTLSPAYVVVLFGTNDAQHFLVPDPGSRGPADHAVVPEFEQRLRAIVSQLLAEGIVPILTTVPKHLRDKRYPDCPTAQDAPSNLRYAIVTSAISARVASVACEERLPLIDLRWALEPLLAHGIGPDGVHPSLYRQGGGVLDEAGLECGFNVRNYVTLRALAVVRDAAASP